MCASVYACVHERVSVCVQVYICVQWCEGVSV